jgi:hypothetical protein
MPQCQFLFSAIFVFQKSYTGNILGIGRNKSQTSYFPDTETESKAETEEGTEVATPPGGTGPPLVAPAMVWAPRAPSNIAPLPINCLRCENPQQIGIHPRKVPQRRRHQSPISGDRSLCFGTLPG